MSEVAWETTVETYLTLDRSVFVSRQYHIGDAKWMAVADILALDFTVRDGKRACWIVEVSSAADPSKIINRAHQMAPDIIDRVEQQLVSHGVIADPAGWQVGLWAFVRAACVASLEEKLGAFSWPSKVKDLESICAPWLYWDQRAR